MVGHLFVSTPVGFLIAIHSLSSAPVCHFCVSCLVSDGVRPCLLPPVRNGSYSGSDLASYSSSTPAVFGSFARFEGTASPECPDTRILGPGLYEHGLQFEGLPESLVHRVLFFQKQLDLCRGRLPRQRMP